MGGLQLVFSWYSTPCTTRKVELQVAHPAFPQGGPENISQYLQHK